MKSSIWLLGSVAALAGVVACGDDSNSGSERVDGDAGNGGAMTGSGGRVGTGGSSAGGSSAGGSSAGGSSAGGSTGSGGDGPEAGAGGAEDGGAGGAMDDGGTGGADGSTGDAGPEPTPFVAALSGAGHDRFFAVTHDDAGNIYAAGQIADTTDAEADYSVVVAKFLPTGALDTNFATGGVFTRNLAVGGLAVEQARGIVVQSTGRIVVAATFEHDVNATGLAVRDSDLALIRLTTDGELDDTFDTDGIATFDIGEGVETVGTSGPTWSSADAVQFLALSGDKLVLHGTTRADGNKVSDGTRRTDSDWLLMQFTSEGVPDATFSTDGKVVLDIAEGNASARSVTVLGDGSIIGAGYTTTSVLVTAPATSQQPVLYKVLANGVFDAAFATADVWDEPGVWHDLAVAPPLRAEAYGAALQNGSFVTIGYGPTPGTGTGTDWVSFRFSAAGVIDPTYGTSGKTYLDPGGWGDNGHGVVSLPDGRIVGFGSGRRAGATETERDGMVGVLGLDGLPVEAFGAGGFRLYDVANHDVFWGGHVAGTSLAVVGTAGAEDGGDDDAMLLILPF